MSDHDDELKLRLNVKFKTGTAPALLAELTSLPERRRVKRLLDLAQIGLLYEQAAGRLPASNSVQQPAGKLPEDHEPEFSNDRPINSAPASGAPIEAEVPAPVAGTPESEVLNKAETNGESNNSVPLARKRPGFNTAMTG
ncbi:hypothetical protein [Pseudomonas oryzihabitans]|uniref:hypothetical protein n=1 Tax=Pseudomonas oryzihabitans TaxID=47885 RepID=UPI00214E5EA3|nr:hypothetical protein [Pseudomonas psychrotolerans]UUW74156.1 hypothetical protein NRG74_22690 [Pseudomonas psychrotolerans]